MKTFKKKLLSAMLTLSMVAGMIQPAGLVAQAAEAEAVNVTRETESKNVLRGKSPSEIAWVNGDTMTFGQSGETDNNTYARATDGASNNRDYHLRFGEASGAAKPSYLEYDFGAVYELTDVNMWRYYDGRNYDPTVIIVSEDDSFAATDTDNVVIYSSDDGNLFGFGATSAEKALVYEAAGYEETAAGKLIDISALSSKPVNARYIRLYVAGSDSNPGNHLVELEAWAGAAKVPAPMENADSCLDLPSFDYNGKVAGETHPDIVDMSLYSVTAETDGKWHGYRYFMAVTPNQNGNSQFENPYVLASNDGINWVKLEELEYPLTGVPYEPKPYHNCDADMVYNPVTDELYVYYIWSDDNCTSAAGLNSQLRLFEIGWNEDADAFYSVSGETAIVSIPKTAKTYSMLSPSVIYDAEEQLWKMWCVDTDVFQSGYMSQVNHIDYRVSLDGINWSQEASLALTFDQAGYVPWHIDVQKINGEYWAVFPAYPDGGTSAATDLFYAKSADGLTWTTYANALLKPDTSSWDDQFIYRSSFLYDEENDLFRLWYSGGAGTSVGWKVAYVENDYSDMISALGTASTAAGTVQAPTATAAAKADYTALNAAIAKHAEENYSEASWAIYAETLALAEAMAADTSATQAEVDALTAELARVETVLREPGEVIGEWVEVDAHSDDIVYEGAWSVVTEGSETLAYTYEGGATASLSFYGSGIKWIGQYDINFGNMEVYIDGEYVETVNQFNYQAGWKNNLFEKTWSADGYHVITLKSAQDGVYGQSGCVDLDYFEVYYNEDQNIRANELLLTTSANEIFTSGSATISAVVNPFNASNKAVSYTSSDTSIATVDADGVVTAKNKGGKVTITATVAGTDLSEAVEITVKEIVKADLRMKVDHENPLYIHHLYRQGNPNLPGPLQGGKSIQGFWASILGTDGQGYDLRDDLEDNQVIVIHASGNVQANASTIAWYEERFVETLNGTPDDPSDDIPFMVMVSNSGTSDGGVYAAPSVEWLSEMYDTYPNMMGVLFSENHNATAEWQRQARSDYMKEMVILAATKGGYVVYSDMNDNYDYIESVLDDQALYDTLKIYKENFILLAKTTSAWGNGSYNSHESVVMGAWMAEIAGNWGSLIDSWMWFIEGFGPLYGADTFSVMGGVEECRGPVSFPELFYEMRMIQQARVGATVFSFEHPDCVTSIGSENGALNHFTPTFTESAVKAMEYMEDYAIPTREEVLEDTIVAYSASEGTIQDLAGTVNLLNPLYGDTNHNGYNRTTMMAYFTGRYGTIPSLPELMPLEEAEAMFGEGNVLTKNSVINELRNAAGIKTFFDSKYPATYKGDGYAHYSDNTWYAYNSNWNIDSRVEANLHTTQNVKLALDQNKTLADITFEPYTTVLVDDAAADQLTIKFNNYLVDKNEIWENYVVSGPGETRHWDSDNNDLMYQYLLNQYIPENETEDDIYRNATIVLNNLTEEPTVAVVNRLNGQVDDPETTWNAEEGTLTIELSGNGWMEFKVTFNDDRSEAPDLNKGSDRLTVDNEHPLLLVPVYCQRYNANGSEMQWGDTLLGRWESIPEDIKPYTVMLIHAGNVENSKAAIEGFYRQQLEIAEANDIPVMLTTITAGLSGWTACGQLTDAFLTEMMQTYDCLKGFASTENYWIYSETVANAAARHLTIAAENGGYMIWYDHISGGTNVFKRAVENNSFRAALNSYGDNFAMCWKNTPSHAYSNAASASYVQGLWLNGTIHQWGGIMDTWKWFESSYGQLFGDVPFNYNGYQVDFGGGKEEECRAVVMEPEALLAIEMLSIYANGGSIYSFEHPGYTQGVHDQNTPLFTEVIYETFKYIIDNPAPTLEEVIEDTEVVIDGDPNINIFTGVTSANQSEPTYMTGQYGLIPVITEVLEVSDALKDKTVDADTLTSANALKEVLADKYLDKAYEGDAFAQKVDDRWIVYNSKVNVDVDQTATVTVGDQSVTAEMEPHTFAILEETSEGIHVYMNNYRVDKNDIWEGYGPSVNKWDPDVENSMQEWLLNNYIVNTVDGPETYRTTTYVLTGLEKAPTIKVLNAKEADFAADVDYSNGTATITVQTNGLYEFVIAADKKLVTDVFDDVDQTWYTEYVQFAYDNGFMNGVDGTNSFEPNGKLTKAQAAQILYNMEGKPEVTDDKVFTELKDVFATEWYADAVAWAYNNSVVTGDLYSKEFRPGEEVTREQLALMMYRYAIHKGYDVTASSDLEGLKNAENVASWALDGVKWAVGAGLISGAVLEDGTMDLAPQGTATRAQMAAILQRFCEAYK